MLSSRTLGSSRERKNDRAGRAVMKVDRRRRDSGRRTQKSWSSPSPRTALTHFLLPLIAMNVLSSPLSAIKVMPRFKSSSQVPQQRSRRDLPLTCIDDDDDSAAAVEALNMMSVEISAMKGLEDDYGSGAPVVTPANAPVEDTTGLFLNDGEIGVEVKSKDFFDLSPRKVTEITTALALRIELDSEGGASTTLGPVLSDLMGESPADLRSCASDAETEVQNNLTARFGAIEASIDGVDLVNAEAWNALASTFVGKEESMYDFASINSLCEESDESPEQQDAKPHVLINRTESGEEVELLFGTSTNEITEVTNGQNSSLTLSSSLHSSSHSSISSAASSTSSGILKPPKRAIGAFDPFGEHCSDFSRRVHFDDLPNPVKIHEDKKSSALARLMQVNASCGAIDIDQLDDDSTASYEYALRYFGCGMKEDDDEYEI